MKDGESVSKLFGRTIKENVVVWRKTEDIIC